MTNDVTRADPRALPINRRHLIAVCAATALPTASAGAEEHDLSLVELKQLIAAQKEAFETCRAKWRIADEIEDRLSLPICRVQVSRLLIGGRDANGNDLYRPIYAYSAEGIDDALKGHMEVRLSLCGGNRCAADRIREAFAERTAKLKAELAEQVSERQRIEAEAGFTAASEDADEVAAIAKAMETHIIEFVPASLAAVRLKTAWVLAAYRGEINSFVSDQDVMAALEALAGAGVR